ncbi:MAG: RNA polymerase sigma factor [Oscillospiraceae bacterium]
MLSYETDADKIVKKYLKDIYAFAFSKVKNKNDAEDITQEVLMQYVSKSPDFENEEHAKHWILKVTENICRNFHKSGWKRYVSFIEETDYELSEESRNIDDKIILDDAIKRLPAKYHHIIHLFYYEKLSINEISEILEISVTAVKSRLKRGRDRLRKILKERGISFED